MAEFELTKALEAHKSALMAELDKHFVAMEYKLNRRVDDLEYKLVRQMNDVESKLDRALEKRVASESDDYNAPDLVCQLDCIRAMVEALSSTRWKSNQDAVMEISEDGVVITVEESGCLQAKFFLKRELFVHYHYAGDGRVWFGLSLGLLIDSLNIFSSPIFSSAGRPATVEIRYPGPDMQLLLRSVGSPEVCMYAEVKTTISDTISGDFQFEHAGNTPLSFTVKSASFKQSIDRLKLPGSCSIQIRMQPDPPSVILKGEGGHCRCKIGYPYNGKSNILIAFQCDREVSHRYNCNFLHATTSNIPSSVMKEDDWTKLQIGRGGVLKIQHLISVATSADVEQPQEILSPGSGINSIAVLKETVMLPLFEPVYKPFEAREAEEKIIRREAEEKIIRREAEEKQVTVRDNKQEKQPETSQENKKQKIIKLFEEADKELERVMSSRFL